MNSDVVVRSPREFLLGSHGLAGSRGLDLWKNRRLGFVTDGLYDQRLRRGNHYRRMVEGLAEVRTQRILVVGIRSKGREAAMTSVLEAMRSDRHAVTTAIGDAEDRGKLENVNLVLSHLDLDDFDWVVMTDDDVRLPASFTDLLIACCLAFDLTIAMPAHRFNSFSGYDVTRRGWGTLARVTRYVEVGPITVFGRACFPKVFPLPELRFGWGVDLHWPVMAQRHGWSIGVVDAVPVEHVKPVGGSYSRQAATDEACRYLAAHGHFSREATFRVVLRHPA